MIECIFTIDYEIYGSGEGSLKELVYEPAETLKTIFEKYQVRFVTFVEAAEFEMIEASGTDPAIDLVKRQIRDLYSEGFEIGLHLHPQWYNAKRESGRWLLDYDEYNLCTLPKARIAEIIGRAIAWLRKVTGEADYAPLAFRAGNWLFQPTQPAAAILAGRGVKVDSSVFKGGLQHQHKLDYRRTLRNGYYWKFAKQVDVPDPDGTLLELPIYTQMVPFWKMLTSKRIGLQQKSAPAAQADTYRISRLRDRLRFLYPLKFDFCRMTLDELTRTVDGVIQEDRLDPKTIRPIVAIGHTKDLVDFDTVERFLTYLDMKGIPVSTFEKVYPKCVAGYSA